MIKIITISNYQLMSELCCIIVNSLCTINHN